MLIHSLAKIANASTRTAVLDGVNYLVVPAVILTEGVHHGSGGPVLYTQEELAKFPEAWNGRPLPVFHPEDNDGNPVTSNSPEVIARQSIGQTFNTVFEDGKLKTELWINLEKAQRIAPEVLSIIKANGRLELSTGVFLEERNTPGTWNSEQYQSVGVNFRPDHVALLPGGTGACSWSDGCGAPRINVEVDNKADNVLKKGLAAILNMFKVNETSFEEVRNALQREVDKMDIIPRTEAPATFHYVKAVFNEDFVFSKEGPEGMQLFRQKYTYSNGTAELVESPYEVHEEKNYVKVNKEGSDNVNGTDNQGMKMNTKEDDSMNKEAKVNALIDNEASPFCCDKDMEYLMGLEEAALDKHIAMLANTEKPKDEAEQPKPTDNTQESEEEVKPMTVDEYVNNAPSEVGEALKGAMALMAEKKVALVDAILNSKTDAYTKEELVAMSVDALTKLAALAKVKPNFQLAGGVQANSAQSATTEEPLEMPTVNYGK